MCLVALKHRIGSCHHQAHGAQRCPLGATRHGRVQGGHTLSGQALGHGLCVVGGDGGAQHDRVAGLELGGQALLAPQHLLNLCGGDHTNNQKMGHAAQLGRNGGNVGS